MKEWIVQSPASGTSTHKVSDPRVVKPKRSANKDFIKKKINQKRPRWARR